MQKRITTQSGLHKTGIRGIQDTRQIVDGKTNEIENSDKKGGSKVQTLNIRQLMKKSNLTPINKPNTSSVRYQWTHGHYV